MNATTNGWFMTQLATEVMNKADASFHAFVPEPNERLSVQRKGDDRGRLREVVTGSLDDYSKNRSSTLNLFNMVRVEWRGQTEMIRDHEASMDRWQAYDTLSIHERKHGLFGGMRERKPIGWSVLNWPPIPRMAWTPCRAGHGLKKAVQYGNPLPMRAARKPPMPGHTARFRAHGSGLPVRTQAFRACGN